MNATRTTLPPVPRARILAYVLAGAVGTVAVVTVLWWAGTRGLAGSELVTARLDALRVGLSIAVGGGGVFALHLAWRRQRATEADLDNRERVLAHQERVAAAAEKDAVIGRVNEAVGLFGSDNPTVRVGALRALATLGQDNPEQRKTIVDFWCYHLRMPVEKAAGPLERLTVQRLLARHLRPENTEFWPGIDLDLTGATLVKFNFSGCEVHVAQFHDATFVGPAMFDGATFWSSAGFGRATFTDTVDFEDVTFRGNAVFRHTTFTREPRFAGAAFLANASFDGATFAPDA